MSEASHSEMRLLDVHPPLRWQWPDQTAQDAQAVSSGDLYNFGVREDTNAIYMLVDLTPTWVFMGGLGTVVVDNVVTGVFTLQFDLTVNVHAYPFALDIWLSSNADGDLNASSPDAGVDSLDGLAELGRKSQDVITVGVPSAGTYTIMYDIFDEPTTLYICHRNPDSTYGINGPHVVPTS